MKYKDLVNAWESLREAARKGDFDLTVKWANYLGVLDNLHPTELWYAIETATDALDGLKDMPHE